MQDAQAGTTGDSHDLSKDHHGQGFSQFGSGQIFGLSALQGMTDSGHSGNADENLTEWNFMEDSIMADVFVTKEGAEAVWQSAQSVYDALQEYGISTLSVAGNFVSEWGEAYAEALLKKAPFPQVRAIAVALFLAKKVYDVASGVADKRKDKIDKLTAGDNSPKVVAAAAAKADEMVGEWLLEEIEKVVIEEGLDAVLDQIPGKYSRDKAKTAIITAWKTFVKEAESGRWERGVIR